MQIGQVRGSERAVQRCHAIEMESSDIAAQGLASLHQRWAVLGGLG